MIVSMNSLPVNVIQPRYAGKEITIAIDSSKRNSAFAVGDANCNLLDYFEFNGKDDGTTQRDVLLLCQNQRKVLSTLFSGAIPKIVGIENIITKKSDDEQYSGGIKHHDSRFKITAVFMSFISFFQDTFDITPELVNVGTWKSTVLPPEFRKRNIGKESLAYFKSINSPLQYCTDDVTDCICILEYLRIAHGLKSGFSIIEPEAPRCKYKLCLANSSVVPANKKVFLYNTNLTLDQNAIVMANNITEKEIAIADVKTSAFTIEEIHSYCTGSFKRKEPALRLVVRRG